MSDSKPRTVPEEAPPSGGNRVTARALLGLWRGLSGTAAWGAGFFRCWGAAGSSAEERARNLEERLARPAALSGLPRGGLWLHGASVGEIRATRPLVEALVASRPDLPLMVTASTVAGRDRARKELGLASRLAPVDADRPLNRFLDTVAPRLHIFIETEIWPNRLLQLQRRGIPAALVSARLAPEKVGRYRRLSAIYGPAISRLSLLAPASPADQARFALLPGAPQKTGPIGNLKWDAATPPPAAEECSALAGELGLDVQRPWLILGSAHPGEAYDLIRATEHQLGSERRVGWLIAPRHPDRFAGEMDKLAALPGGIWRASAGPGPRDASRIVLDRIGLLPRVYPLGTAALLGGTFVPVGGHSPLEAAVAGCPLVSGPHIQHQIDLVEPLAAVGAVVSVSTIPEAAAVFARWITDQGSAAAAGAAARAEVSSRRGHAGRLAAAVLELLG